MMSRQLQITLTCKSQHLSDVIPIPEEPTAVQALHDATLLIHHHQGAVGAILTEEQEGHIQRDALCLYETRCQEHHNTTQAKIDRLTCDGRITRTVEIFPDSTYTDEQLRILATLDAVIAMNCYHGPMMMAELNATLYAHYHKVYRLPNGEGDYYTLVGDRLRYIANDVAQGEVDGDEIHAEYRIDATNAEQGVYHLEGSYGGELVDGELDEDSSCRLSLWFKNGKLGRDAGLPALEDDDYKMWFREDRCHRDDNPAIIYSNGYVVWVKDGVEISKFVDGDDVVVDLSGYIR